MIGTKWSEKGNSKHAKGHSLRLAVWSLVGYLYFSRSFSPEFQSFLQEMIGKRVSFVWIIDSVVTNCRHWTYSPLYHHSRFPPVPRITRSHSLFLNQPFTLVFFRFHSTSNWFARRFPFRYNQVRRRKELSEHHHYGAMSGEFYWTLKNWYFKLRWSQYIDFSVTSCSRPHTLGPLWKLIRWYCRRRVESYGSLIPIRDRQKIPANSLKFTSSLDLSDNTFFHVYSDGRNFFGD